MFFILCVRKMDGFKKIIGDSFILIPEQIYFFETVRFSTYLTANWGYYIIFRKEFPRYKF